MSFKNDKYRQTQPVGARIARPTHDRDIARPFHNVGARIARPTHDRDITHPFRNVGARIARPTHDRDITHPTRNVGARIARPTHDRDIAHPFRNVGARIARPTKIGMIVETAMRQIGEKYETAALDKYVIMPNHIHMILVLNPTEDSEHAAIVKQFKDSGRAMRAPTISTIVNQFKGYVTKQIGFSIWQKLYYDHIIRDESEYQRIWQYIDENPIRWNEDEYYVI